MILSLLSVHDSLYTQNYIHKRSISVAGEIRQKALLKQLSLRPKVSIVMPTFNSSIIYLERVIQSIQRQTYENWELCIADDFSSSEAVRGCLERAAQEDARIKLKFRNVNGHISQASNDALDLATGEYIALVDHDDELLPYALFCVIKAINDNPEALLLYSDEDKIDAYGNRFTPHIKPKWNSELARSQNFISHLGVYETKRIRTIGGFRKGYEGSQDHDLMLRFVKDLSPQQIEHIPEVLYHWRTLPESTAGQGTASKPYAVINGRRAVEEIVLTENEGPAKVEIAFGMYRTKRWLAPNDCGPVILLLVGPNSNAYVERWQESIRSEAPQVTPRFHCVETSKNPSVRALSPDAPPDGDEVLLSRIKALSQEEPNSILFIVDAALRPPKDKWFNQLCAQARRKSVGFATAKVVGSDQLIHHAGLEITHRGMTPIAHGVHSGSIEKFGRYLLTYNACAPHPFLLAVESDKIKACGGFSINTNYIASFGTTVQNMSNLGLSTVVDSWLPFSHPCPAKSLAEKS